MLFEEGRLWLYGMLLALLRTYLEPDGKAVRDLIVFDRAKEEVYKISTSATFPWSARRLCLLRGFFHSFARELPCRDHRSKSGIFATSALGVGWCTRCASVGRGGRHDLQSCWDIQLLRRDVESSRGNQQKKKENWFWKLPDLTSRTLILCCIKMSCQKKTTSQGFFSQLKVWIEVAAKVIQHSTPFRNPKTDEQEKTFKFVTYK